MPKFLFTIIPLIHPIDLLDNATGKELVIHRLTHSTKHIVYIVLLCELFLLTLPISNSMRVIFQLYCCQWLGQQYILCGGNDQNMIRVIDRGTLNVSRQI